MTIYVEFWSRKPTNLTAQAKYQCTKYQCIMQKLQWEFVHMKFPILKETFIWNIWTQLQVGYSLVITAVAGRLQPSDEVAPKLSKVGRNEHTLY